MEAIRRRCSASQNLSFFCGIFKAAVRSSISTAAASSQSTEANVAYDIQIKEKLLHDSRVQVTVTVPPQASQVYFDAILWKKHDGPEPAGAQVCTCIACTCKTLPNLILPMHIECIVQCM